MESAATEAPATPAEPVSPVARLMQVMTARNQRRQEKRNAALQGSDELPWWKRDDRQFKVTPSTGRPIASLDRRPRRERRAEESAQRKAALAAHKARQAQG